MSRLVLALFVVIGLCAPFGGSAEAQVWKLKKGKTTTSAKTTKKKSTRTARPTVRKKRAANKPRKVELVPDDADRDADHADVPADRDRDEPADEPIVIKVEELD